MNCPDCLLPIPVGQSCPCYAGSVSASPRRVPAIWDPAERLMARNAELRAFVVDLLDPERFGHAVTPEVHAAARRLLGIGGPS